MKFNRTILITGGASGIGAATVRYFSQKKWNVCFTDIDDLKAEAFLEELADHDNLLYVHADVRYFTDMSTSVTRCVETFGGLNALFSNAGIHYMADILSTSEEKWDEVMDINLKGTFHTVKAALPQLLKQQHASIVLMGSDQSFIAKRNSFVYGASKGAIAQMTKNLALDYAKEGVRVNCVCPATIDTPLAHKALQRYADLHFEGDFEKVLELENAEFPIGRIGKVQEVAASVYFLISEEASYITGTLLPVDGGYTAE